MSIYVVRRSRTGVCMCVCMYVSSMYACMCVCACSGREEKQRKKRSRGRERDVRTVRMDFDPADEGTADRTRVGLFVCAGISTPQVLDIPGEI